MRGMHNCSEYGIRETSDQAQPLLSPRIGTETGTILVRATGAVVVMTSP